MSSIPQPVYPSAPQTSSLGNPTHQPPHYGVPAPAPDYGTFGTVPTKPGVVYFGEKWATRKGPTFFIILGSILAVFGLLALAGGAIGPGAGIFTVGVAFVGIGFYNRGALVHVEILCDAQGVTVRRNNRKQGALPPIWIPWSTVSATRCTMRVIHSQSTEGGSNITYVQEFALDASSVAAFQTDEKTTKGLPAFIDLCNRSTTHLGYAWIPKKTAHGQPVIETVYKYAKVPL